MPVRAASNCRPEARRPGPPSPRPRPAVPALRPSLLASSRRPIDAEHPASVVISGRWGAPGYAAESGSAAPGEPPRDHRGTSQPLLTQPSRPRTVYAGGFGLMGCPGGLWCTNRSRKPKPSRILTPGGRSDRCQRQRGLKGQPTAEADTSGPGMRHRGGHREDDLGYLKPDVRPTCGRTAGNVSGVAHNIGRSSRRT